MSFTKGGVERREAEWAQSKCGEGPCDDPKETLERCGCSRTRA